MVMSSMPTMPMMTVVTADTHEIAVIVAATLRKSLCTPLPNTCRSRRSAVYVFTRRMPPTVSASRPLTSALIAPRCRKIGRSRLNAAAITPPNAMQDHQRDRRHPPVEPEQHAERDRRRHEPAQQLHDAGADQVPDPFGVGHDPGDQHPGLGRVEVAHRQAQQVLLHRLSQVGDRPLRRDAHDLRQPERGRRLHQRREAHRERQFAQQVHAVLRQDAVDEEFRAGGKHQAGQTVHHHQQHADGELAAVGPDQFAGLAPDHLGRDPLLLLLVG